MTEGWVDYLTGPFGFVFAFAAGVLSFLSPCVLPLVPAYLAHMTGTAAVEEDGRPARRETVTHAVAFVAGFTAVFTLVGASVGLLSLAFSGNDAYWVRDHQRLLAQVGAVFLMVLGLNLMGVIRIPVLFRTYALEPAMATGPLGGTSGGAGAVLATRTAPRAWYAVRYGKSFGVGATFALGWTPCIGPVLGAILGLALTSADVAKGAWLLLVYSLGLGVPFVLTAFAVEPITAFLRRHRGLMPAVELAAGALVLFVGVLIFTDNATAFNGWFSRIPGLDELNNI